MINDPIAMEDFKTFFEDLYRPLKADAFKLAKFNPHFICAGSTANIKNKTLKDFLDVYAPSRPGFVAMRTKCDTPKVEIRVRRTEEERDGKPWPTLNHRLHSQLGKLSSETLTGPAATSDTGVAAEDGGAAAVEDAVEGVGAAAAASTVGVVVPAGPALSSKGKRKQQVQLEQPATKKAKDEKTFSPINEGRAKYRGHNCFNRRAKMPWVGQGKGQKKNQAAANDVAKSLYPAGYTEAVAKDATTCDRRNIIWRLPGSKGRYPHELLANQIANRSPLDASATASSTDAHPRACPPLLDASGNPVQTSARGSLDIFEKDNTDISKRAYLGDFLRFYAEERGLKYNEVPLADADDVQVSQDWAIEFRKTQSTVSSWNKPRLQEECKHRGYAEAEWEHLNKPNLYKFVRAQMQQDCEHDESDDDET